MRSPSHEWRMTFLALFGGLPATVILLILLWTSTAPPKVQWTATVVLLTWWLGFSLAVRDQVARPLQTLSNLLGALREGDYSIRARSPGPQEPLGLAMLEANTLAATLREQRLGALEASALLRKVMEEIEVAIFAFDGQGILRLVNRAGERLLDTPSSRLLGRSASEAALDGLLEGPARRTVDRTFPGGKGRWEIRRSIFRQEGLSHQLVVIADLSRTLREEETQAWQRLIRVLGHEINNSLAPIKSLAGSLQGILARETRAPDWEEDLRRGLSVIGDRADALSRFMSAYARLTRLPPPDRRPMRVADWVERVVGLETRLEVEIVVGPDVMVRADPDQLDQLLINLVQNAVDAALVTTGVVQTGWEIGEGRLEVWVRDTGPGLGETTNLFVPFFTTKPGGTGIGLTLSRQIAEAHGGSLALEENVETPGCIARLSLPMERSA